MPYRAECDCGFKGPLRGSWAVAEVDMDRHNFAPDGTPVGWEKYHHAKLRRVKQEAS